MSRQGMTAACVPGLAAGALGQPVRLSVEVSKAGAEISPLVYGRW